MIGRAGLAFLVVLAACSNATSDGNSGNSGVSGNSAQEEKKFAGCTVDQYMLMAIGDYGSYGSTKSCTVINRSYIDGLLATYRQYATAASYMAHPY